MQAGGGAGARSGRLADEHAAANKVLEGAEDAEDGDRARSLPVTSPVVSDVGSAVEERLPPRPEWLIHHPPQLTGFGIAQG